MAISWRYVLWVLPMHVVIYIFNFVYTGQQPCIWGVLKTGGTQSHHGCFNTEMV